MIREATAGDVPAIVAMAERFIASTSYGAHLALNTERLWGLAEELVAAEHAVILVADDGVGLAGMIAVLRYAHPMSGEPMASELCWWVDEAARRTTAGPRLLRAAEAWAQARGAAFIQAGAPTARVGVFYERLGYQAVEVLYQRRLSC